MENILPQRKHPRFKNYDYSSAGIYFITICTQNKRCLFSRIAKPELILTEAETNRMETTGEAEYTVFGRIAEQEIASINERYPFAVVEQYVIMPNHIHMIMVLDPQAENVPPRPGITDIVCAYKSLTTMKCRKHGAHGKLFQTSFYEHIIRSREEHQQIMQYIHDNPIRWYYDELYTEMP